MWDQFLKGFSILAWCAYLPTFDPIKIFVADNPLVFVVNMESETSTIACDSLNP